MCVCVSVCVSVCPDNKFLTCDPDIWHAGNLDTHWVKFEGQGGNAAKMVGATSSSGFSSSRRSEGQ